MRLAAFVAAAGVLLGGCGTMTLQDVREWNADLLGQIVVGTWISDPDPRNELCQRRVLEVSALDDLTPEERRDVWLMSWLTSAGTEIGDARRVVRLVPLESPGHGGTTLEQYRIVGGDTERPNLADLELISRCEVRARGYTPRFTLQNGCAKRGDPGNWLEAAKVTWRPGQFDTRVEGFTGGAGPFSWGGCHFARPR